MRPLDWILWGTAGLEGSLTAAVYLNGRPHYARLIAEHKKDFRLAALAPGALYLIDRFSLFERYPRLMAGIHYRMISLYGSQKALPAARMFAAETLSAAWLAILLFTLMGALLMDPLYVVYGVAFAILLPLLMKKELDRRLKRKKRQMLLLLPEFLNRLALLVGAGETIQRALIHSVESMGTDTDHPLTKELRLLTSQISHQVPFQKAMEDFSKRCGMQEVTVFTTVVLMNYRRGGDDFIMSLRQLSRDMWERRKAMTRTLGEEAASKLVFPMVMIFMVVMVIVGAPAILMMNE